MSSARPITTRKVEPAPDRDASSLRPTEIRYGWCPYGDINLMSGDGSVSLNVQPAAIDEGGYNIPNPQGKKLPKNQLIPFPTFMATQQVPDPEQLDSSGRAKLVTGNVQVTAADAAEMVNRTYAGWGFTILTSLQGVDQDTAFRIFQVVQPLDYPMGELVGELSFADERIDSRAPITFPSVPGYEVEPLRNDDERAKARVLAAEMLAGAEIAVMLATETLDATEASMVQKYSGGNGKAGPDPLDRRLTAELGRELPKMIGNEKKNELAEIKDSLQFLAGREASRADKERIAELEARLAAMEAPQPTETPVMGTCGAIKADGTACGMFTKDGERCRHHQE